jgi:mono/diheme cytochrome c family protein
VTSKAVRRAQRRTLVAAALLSVVVAPACTRIDDALASVPIFAFMRNSPAFDPYGHPLPPAPGSVPFESPAGPALPPLEATEQALNAWAAGPWGQNPYAPGDAAVLALGRVMYDRHCAVCHGIEGRGDGPLHAPHAFPLMPSLVAPPGSGLSDGYVYGVIRAGRGLMPAYGARMSHDERWAVVTYVNSLQLAAGVQQQPPAQDPAAAAGAGASPTLPQVPQQPDTMPAVPPDTVVPPDTTPMVPPDTMPGARPDPTAGAQ